MNKDELINTIADKTGHSKIDTRKLLDGYIEVITKALTESNTIQLVGFATLSVVDRAARTGRNPNTGKELQIAASKAVKFSAGKMLKDAINNTSNSKSNNSNKNNKNKQTKKK